MSKSEKKKDKHRFEHDKEKMTLSKFGYIVAHNFNIVLFIEGILIIALARQISGILHWIVGPTLIFFGLAGIIYCLVKRRSRDMNKFAGVAIVLVLIGIVVILRLQGATGMISFIFGLVGMALGCLRLIDFLSTVRVKFWPAFFDLCYAIATLGLSFALLYNQFESRYILLILLGCLHIVLSLRSLAARALENEKVREAAHKVVDFSAQLNEKIVDTLHLKPQSDKHQEPLAAADAAEDCGAVSDTELSPQNRTEESSEG